MTTETKLIYLPKKLIFLETPQTNPLIQEKHYQIFSQSFLIIVTKSKQHTQESSSEYDGTLYKSRFFIVSFVLLGLLLKPREKDIFKIKLKLCTYIHFLVIPIIDFFLQFILATQ